MAEPITAASVQAGLAEAGMPGSVSSVAPLEGGVSNLTYRVERGDGPPVVIRIQRERGIFEPYDVVREARVLQALQSTAVPAPEVITIQHESKALGAPFFVMEFVDAPHMGQVARSSAVTDAYVRAVAEIHGVDWEQVGMAFLGAPEVGEMAAERDLAAVRLRAEGHGCANEPFIEETGKWLDGQLPNTTELVLCQGDINVYNYLFRDEQVVAVVDWEQAQISDRMSDLGLLSALSYLLGAEGPPTRLPIIAPYLALTESDAATLPYFVMAALHKLAVIHRIWSAESGSPPWYSWDAVLDSARRVRDMIDAGTAVN